ncbi:Uma2 family endonuclease [Chondromyces apiculatus]|nr:Uma2 family endonuclease [Chondromyces apiculatus]
MTAPPRHPVTADQIRSGDPYEISGGRLIEVLPTGRRGSRGNLMGGTVLDSDPAVESAGVDTGFSPRPDLLRAPDVSIGNVSSDPGWATEAPSLAVEYADRGQDEADLQQKILELLDAGTRWVWVVRLHGKRRVEVYEPAASEPSGARRIVRPARVLHPGEQLVAPGVLRNPVPVEALYDREAAHEITLRNLLQRRGYESLEAVQAQAMAKGLEQGRAESLRAALVDLYEAYGLVLSAEQEAAVQAMDIGELEALRAALKRERRWPGPR